jgi:hypothetical protein
MSLAVCESCLFLLLADNFAGIPLKMVTDKGSETTDVYGFMNALRYVHVFLLMQMLHVQSRV